MLPRRTIWFETLEDRCLYAAQLPALSSLPGLFDAAQPASHPALPAYFDTFNPALGGAAAGGTPAIAEWTRTAGPDQSLAVTADQLGTADQANAVVFGETNARNGTLSSAAITSVDGAAAGLHLGADLPANSMYLLWLQNGSGYGQAVAVNRAEAWWVGPDAAPAGGSVSIYGRNLTLGAAWRASVYLEPGPGNSAAPRWVRVTSANPYQLTIALPADLAAGNWQVWAHNGHGGDLGWSKPVALTVTAARAWSGPMFNVRKYGAKGDGRTDDQAAIRAAVDAAEQVPNSTVFIPAGRYLVNGGLAYLHDIRILGQGMGATTIIAGPAFQTAGGADPTRECLIFSPTQNVELANFGMSANGNLTGSLPDLVYARQSSDIRFTRVRFDAPGFNPADINESHRMSFSGCLFTGKEVFMGNASQVSFDACRFLMTNDSVSALLTWGGQQLSLTRNVVQNFRPFNENDGSGWGLGRFLCGNDIWGAAADIYLSGNRTIGLGVRSGYWEQNNGEQVMWEGTLTLFDGQAVSGTSDSVSLDNYTDTTVLDHEFTVSIVGGKGIGQTRTVSSNAGGVISLTQPWNVAPDATSRVVVETLPHNITVYGNSFGGRPKIFTNAAENASVGVELFEGGADIVVDRNQFHMVRTDVALWGGSNELGPTHVNPMMFSYVANNLFGQTRYAVRWCRRGSDAGLPFLGNTLRLNTDLGIVSDAIWVATATEWASLPQIPKINLVDGTFNGGATGNLLMDTPSEEAGGILLRNRSRFRASFGFQLS